MFQKDSKSNKGTAIDIQYYYYRSIMYSCSCTAACTAVLNLVLECDTHTAVKHAHSGFMRSFTYEHTLFMLWSSPPN